MEQGQFLRTYLPDSQGGPLSCSAQNVTHPSANLGFCSGGRAVSNASCAEKCGTLVLSSKSLSAGEFG
eukprot:scaffold9602_cov70-Skeletonema_dohrnii-CCMP3373.AAC.2